MSTYEVPASATQLREGVIAVVTVDGVTPSTGKRRGRAGSEPTLATAVATLESKLAVEDTHSRRQRPR
jgi:hypothetical protein